VRRIAAPSSPRPPALQHLTISLTFLRHRFFDEFLIYIIRNKMKRSAAQTSFEVNTPLVALTAGQAGRIAKSFVMLLMSNATGEAAVDDLIGNYPALGELDKEYRWFRPMMEAIATQLMSGVAYGQCRSAGEASGRARAKCNTKRAGERGRSERASDASVRASAGEASVRTSAGEASVRACE
jgi:hypothetical protein